MSDQTNVYTDIQLIDIDYVIKKYIEDNIAYTFEDGTKTKVDFKNQERWARTFKRVDESDITGDLYTFPLILLNRESIDIQKNQFPHWLPDELIQYELIKYNKPTFEDTERVEYAYSRLPLKITTSYTIDIISNLLLYNDKNVEQFLLHESKFWQTEGYHLRVTYNNVSNSSIVASAGQERLIRHTSMLNVDGYLLPETNNNGNNIVFKKIPTVRKVNYSETEMSYSEFVQKFKNKQDTSHGILNI